MSDDKYTPDNGPAYVAGVDFTLGEPYTSQDMYRDMGIGSRVAVEKDGVIYTDTITAVTHKSPEWVPPVQPTGWRRILRAVTPRRLRKPLPQSPPKPASVTITVGDHDPMARLQVTARDIQAMIDKFDAT